MDVTDVLRDRMGEPSGLQCMTVVSIAVHVVVFARLHVRAWALAGSQQRNEPATMMTITLGGGGEGPQSGGLTTMGGAAGPGGSAARRAARSRPSAGGRGPGNDRADARRAQARPRRPPRSSRRPTRRGGGRRRAARRPSAGQRGRRDRRARTGLWPVERRRPGVAGTLDVGDFCCPDYLVDDGDAHQGRTGTKARTSPAWRSSSSRFGATASLADIALEQSSSFPIADLAAQRAVILTKQLPPLPDAFPNPTLTVHLHFQYRTVTS